MSFIINGEGQRVAVEFDVDWFSQPCVIYSDGATLKDMYLLNLYKGRFNNDTQKEPELVMQIEYRDNPPTKDQIMYRMWKNGLSRYDVATIERGYYLDWETVD